MANPGGPASTETGHSTINADQQHVSMRFLLDIVNDATVSAKAKLALLKSRGSAISIADMFDMQMLMNHLSQLSEMSTAVVSASNSAIASMARNVKG